jgi:predicted secreted protein
VQAALKQALDAALAEARKIAQPGQVDVQTGNFALYPRYGVPSKSGSPVITGWQGSAEMLVQGKDVATIAQLTGRVQTMTIARVGYTLSRQVREKIEAEVVAQAIARWRAQAAQMSQQFGYSGYTVREINVSTNTPGPGPLVGMARATAAGMSSDAALPTEAGKIDVGATVSGSAQMTR